MLSKINMIEKLSFLDSNPLSARVLSGPGTFNRPDSPFQSLLQKEMIPLESLEPILLNFLIKTIRSICETKTQWDALSLFPALPPWAEGPTPVVSLKGTPPLEGNPSLTAPISKRQDFDDLIQKAGSEYGVDPALIKAVISVESNGNPRAVSPAGAQGLMQLMPKTAAELGVTDPFDPVQNIRAGTRYLSQLQNRYQGDLKLTLAAYNWGMGNVERKPEALPRETRNYIVRVEKNYQSFQQASSLA